MNMTNAPENKLMCFSIRLSMVFFKEIFKKKCCYCCIINVFLFPVSVKQTFMLILFGIILFLVRLWFVLPRHDNLIFKKRTGHCKTCIILGSGGHTTEMMQLVKGLDLTRYTPRCYVIADNDRLSEEKAREYEQEMKKARLFLICNIILY
ncbi:hypothetical protein RMCBS344292_13246 [Rhizopus microsporus]|nr:hypothetical protein RMCBS344292_13246 [Rhizopus microsporus]